MNQTRWSFAIACCLLCSVGTLARAPLTFEERVKPQEAIERVCYAHRIWPKENPLPKPPFEQMVPKAQIEAKVTDYLKKCAALDTFWQRPITGEQLQAEMDRMAKGTKDPATLKELFAALKDDPTLIAECLVRPTLADQAIHEAYEADAATVERPFGSWWQEVSPALPIPAPLAGDASFALPNPDLARSPEADGNAWTATSTTANCPSIRSYHTAIWTGTEMIVWGGSYTNTGGRYNPATDTWVATSTGGNCPAARRLHTAVWTGAEMIVWGGEFATSPWELDSGGRYNPSADTWAATSTGTNCPLERHGHKAVWTGTEMIVWGGYNGLYLNTGGRYSPLSDSWAATSTGTDCPSIRSSHTAIWTGTEMIVWGGLMYDYTTHYYNTGGRYNPSSDTWTATSTWMCPSARARHSAVWTGTEMIIWGGSATPLGRRYNPATNAWAPVSEGTNCPANRSGHTAVWTGKEMILWGGGSNTGGRYDLAAGVWCATSTDTNCPVRRDSHTAVWTGTQMIIWGGYYNMSTYNTGGIYTPCTSPGPPSITSIADNDVCAFTGITIAYTPGDGAASHDLYKDGSLVVSGYASGSTYAPSDWLNHSYVVQAVGGSCAMNSAPAIFADSTLPGAPVITAVNDVDWCAGSGIKVVYTAGSYALSHNLVQDGSVVVTGYTSNATYIPGDALTHTFVVRAVSACSTADSSGVAGTDNNDAPGAPVITAVNDLDPCAQSGVAIVYTPGSNALRHDLYKDGALAVSSYGPGATYAPGDIASHTYVVQAVYGSCLTTSTGAAGTDANGAPGGPVISSVLDIDACSQSGVKVTYAAGYGATSHNLLKDGSVVVTGYPSGATYVPGDGSGHTYKVRAVNTCGTSDSPGVAGTDAGLGAPVITDIEAVDPCAQSGIAVTYTAGSGAASHNLLKDGTVVVTGFESGATYNPGDPVAHTYVVRAVNGPCTADSAGAVFADAALCGPPAEAAPGSSPSNAQTWTGKDTQGWPAVSSATSYTLYRGAKADLPNLLNSSTDSCTKYAGAALSATIVEDPSSLEGQFYWYLVTASSAGGEGPAGSATAGARVVNSSGGCP